MAASNYYGYTSGVPHSQTYSQVQNPPVQSAYTPQASSAYGVAATGTAATHYGQHQQAQRQVVQPTYSAATAATAYASQTPGTAYGYTARSQDAPPPPPPTNTTYQHSHTGYATTPQSYYDTKTTYDTKSYYSQQPHSTSVQQGGQSAYYNAGATTAAKSSYPSSAATAYTAPVSATPVVAKTQPQQQAYTHSSVSNVAYPYSASRNQTASYNQGHSYNSGSYNQASNNANAYTAPQQPQAYEAAVYNAASTMFQQQQQQYQPRQPWKKTGGGAGGGGGGNSQISKPMYNKPKKPPAQPQIHYCEVCKISCAGPQTYKEHLDGQRHKKKEAANKKLKDEPVAHNTHRCELCDVTCTGNDAFNAHLKGAKHLKVVKLHQKLGKPIPEVQLVKSDVKKDDGKDDKPRPLMKKPVAKKMVAPKITFVGGSKLVSTIPGGDASAPASTTSSEQDSNSQEMDDKSMEDDGSDKEEEGDIDKKVGEEFIEEVKGGEGGKVTSYHCKLCDCKFNDHNARDAHLGGRRHRLNYKKKVQPDLKVDTKPNSRRVNKLQEDRLRRQWELEMRRRQQEMWRREEEMRWREEELRRWEQQEYWRRMEEEERFFEEEERWRRYEAEYLEWERRQRMAHEFDRYPGPGPHPGIPPRHADDMPPPPPRPRYDTPDDRQVMAKHASIYPNEQELQAVQNIVSATEKALKLVSDFLAEEDNPQAMETEEAKKEAKVEVKTEVKEVKNEEANAEDKSQQPPRALKGVMRVGVLAKGLLLHQRLDVDLVVLCHDRPTLTLLKRVSENLPVQLQKVTEEKYEVKMVPENSGLTVSHTGETPTPVTVTVTMTSPVMREITQADGTQAPPAEDECDILDKQKCLDALASLRHAKWFQAKANGVQSCVVIIRILRDLCQRVPAFAPLCGSMSSRVKDHAIELLVEKSLSSNHPMGPGEGFRRVLEGVSSGIFLSGGPGLCDPCEKETTDAAGHMTPQEREDLTAAAQHALRLQVFRQLHKVLGIDPLPPPKMRGPKRGGRFKRRREDSGHDENAKKEKKEGDEANSEKMEVAESAGDTKPAEEPVKA